MKGHKDYEFLSIEQRKVMLAYFSSFVRKLPISYITFVYRRSQFRRSGKANGAHGARHLLRHD